MPENLEKNKQNPVEHPFYPPTDEELEEAYAEYKRTECLPFRFHCKPTYNFQSIEFDFDGSVDDIPTMMEIYKALLNQLMAVAPAQPTATPARDLATDKQKEIMNKFGIKYKSTTTREEAQTLIKASIEAVQK